MPKASKGGFYAVKAGRVPGVYGTWDLCKEQIDKFPNARHKKFATYAEAHEFALPGRPVPSDGAGPSTSTAPPATRPAHRKKPYDRQKTVSAPLSHNAFTTTDESGWEIIYTDGACKNNQGSGANKRAGVGVWYGPGDERNLAERCPGDQTNNRAELIGLIRALETFPHSKQPLLLKTDSKYAIQCMEEWIHGWIKKGWKKSDGQPVLNAPLIRCLSALLDERAFSGQKVRLVHVRGHAGEEGNEGADQLANQGCWLSAEEERDWDAFVAKVKARKESTARTVAASAVDSIVAAASSGTMADGSEVSQVELSPAAAA